MGSGTYRKRLIRGAVVFYTVWLSPMFLLGCFGVEATIVWVLAIFVGFFAALACARFVEGTEAIEYFIESLTLLSNTVSNVTGIKNRFVLIFVTIFLATLAGTIIEIRVSKILERLWERFIPPLFPTRL